MHDSFLDGNEIIEDSISRYYQDTSKETLIGVLDAIRTRMKQDGHFMIPVTTSDDGNTFSFRTVQNENGEQWMVLFTSPGEFEKGEPSNILSNFIDTTLKSCLDFGHNGFVINPWGQSFTLSKDLIQLIYEADNSVKLAAIEFSHNRTKENYESLLHELNYSRVWIPCNAIMSERDQAMLEKAIENAEDDLCALLGQEYINHDNVRMVPELLQNDDGLLYFPVFSSVAEMDEDARQASKMEKDFSDAVRMAQNNKAKIEAIVLNPFTEAIVFPMVIFEDVPKGNRVEKKPAKAKKSAPNLEGLVLTLKSKEKDAHATGVLQAKKAILVKAGSRISIESRLHLVASMQKNAQLRSQLIESGIIKDRVFMEDYLFNSPSQAASVLLGASFSGNDRWRDKKGVTLGKRLGKGEP